MSRGNRIVASVTPLLSAMLPSRAGSRVGMLAYHRVQPWTPGLPPATFNVPPEVFREQMAGLIGRGFRFVRLTEVIEANRLRRPLPAQSVVLTFDDAFESVYRHAYPILQELDVPAVAFLSTAYLDSQQPFPFDRWGQAHRDQVPPQAYRPLGIEQCRTMAAGGLVEFGSHTHTHQDFRRRGDDLRRDVRRSLHIVRDLFDCEDVTFAFPYGKPEFGYAGGALSQAARRAGVCCALSTECAPVDPLRDDPFEWGRFCCGDWDTSRSIAAKLRGWYGWAPRVQGWLDGLRGYDRSVEFDSPTSVPESLADDPCAAGLVAQSFAALGQLPAEGGRHA